MSCQCPPLSLLGNGRLNLRHGFFQYHHVLVIQRQLKTPAVQSVSSIN